MIDLDQINVANFKAWGEALQPTYTPRGGTAFQVDGVFDDGFRVVDMLEDKPPANTTSPVLGVRLVQFAGKAPGGMPAQGDKVFVPRVATTYVVKNVEPDSHGWALLRLNEAAP